MMRFLVLLMAASIVMAGLVYAAPPPGGPGPFSEWYGTLKTPSGGSCCDESDCRPVEAVRSVRVEDEFGNLEWRYEVLITPASHGAAAAIWVQVPPDRVLARENPTGRPVACWLPTTGVLCFIRPSEI
jgi:hypothetical protein